jgi:hypothetical protein
MAGGVAMSGEITNRERINWQLRTTRVLGDLLTLAGRDGLPPIAWTVGNAGANLVGRCLDTAAARRIAAFEAWTAAIGAVCRPEFVDAAGVTCLRAVAKDYDGFVDVVVMADVWLDD